MIIGSSKWIEYERVEYKLPLKKHLILLAVQAKEIGIYHTVLNKFLLYSGISFLFGAGLDTELCHLFYKITILNPIGS